MGFNELSKYNEVHWLKCLGFSVLLSLQTTNHKPLVVKTRSSEQWDFVEIGLYCLCNRYNFDIARRYGEHADCRNLHYGEQGKKIRWLKIPQIALKWLLSIKNRKPSSPRNFLSVFWSIKLKIGQQFGEGFYKYPDTEWQRKDFFKSIHKCLISIKN